MVQYKAIEVIPEDFYAEIDGSGKKYHFTVFTNAASIKYHDKWGDKDLIKIIADIGQAACIGTLAYWLLAPEHKADFESEEDFNNKLQTYYAKKSDLDTKVLKACAIGFAQEDIDDKDKGAAADGARFPADVAGGGTGGKTAKGNWFKRLFNIKLKPAANANKII